MGALPETYRITLSPFQPSSRGVHSVVGHLTPKGFLAKQLCFVGTPSANAPLASSIDPSNAIYPELSHLVTSLEGVYAPRTSIPIVASVGLITDVLFKKQSWLSSPAAAPLNEHLENGDVILAVNALDHDQFVHATRLLLRHGNGNVLTHIFHWPSNPAQ